MFFRFYATALYFTEAEKSVKISKSVDILRVSRYN